jgi:hypothetical protein
MYVLAYSRREKAEVNQLHLVSPVFLASAVNIKNRRITVLFREYRQCSWGKACPFFGVEGLVSGRSGASAQLSLLQSGIWYLVSA